MSDFSWLTGATSDSTADVVADVKAEAVWLVLHMQANGTREDIASALRTLRLVWGDPPPVPDEWHGPTRHARGGVVTARLDRADHGPTLRDLLSHSSVGCPRNPISCGHMLVDHGDGWDDKGQPTNPVCRVRGCDCDGIS